MFQGLDLPLGDVCRNEIIVIVHIFLRAVPPCNGNHAGDRCMMCKSTILVTLETLVGLAALGQAVIFGWFVVVAITTITGLAADLTADLAALLAGLNGINLAMSKLAGADALIWLTILSETIVLCKKD